MIDYDNPTVVDFFVILIALIGPVVYALFIDKYQKNTPDPRRRKF
jgi:hypothetical protein